MCGSIIVRGARHEEPKERGEEGAGARGGEGEGEREGGGKKKKSRG